jgi:hypothetical protein
MTADEAYTLAFQTVLAKIKEAAENGKFSIQLTGIPKYAAEKLKENYGYDYILVGQLEDTVKFLW